MRIETLPSAIPMKEATFRPWYEARPGTKLGNGCRDYYTHPSETSLHFTRHVNSLSRNQDIKGEFTKRHGKTTPYKFYSMQEITPNYVKAHDGANGQYPYYRPLAGPLGGQYPQHPGLSKRVPEDNLETTYNHDYGRKNGNFTAGFINNKQPYNMAPMPGVGSGYGVNNNTINGVSWVPESKKGLYNTTQKDDFKPVPCSKAVCCLAENLADKCDFCEAADACAKTQTTQCPN